MLFNTLLNLVRAVRGERHHRSPMTRARARRQVCCQTEKQLLWQTERSCGGEPCVNGVFAPCEGAETGEDFSFPQVKRAALSLPEGGLPVLVCAESERPIG